MPLEPRIRDLSRRVDRARKFGENTCGASRHLHMMARGLLAKRGYPMLTEEPEHCAETMLGVLESLWKGRSRIARQEAALKQLVDVVRRMDAAIEAKRPTETEYRAALAAADACINRRNTGD